MLMKILIFYHGQIFIILESRSGDLKDYDYIQKLNC